MHLLGSPFARTEPAPDLTAWLLDSFIGEDAWLENEDHRPLRAASIACLWTSADNSRQGKTVLATAQLMPPGGSDGFLRARAEQQILDWFGDMPDFLLTFSAPHMMFADDATFCAIGSHELYHCAQKLDKFGAPMFNRETGKPVWTIRGHDVEQFVGVVRDFGADAAGVRQMVEAANSGPRFNRVALDAVCGCGARV